MSSIETERPEPLYLTVKEASEITRLSVVTVYRLIAKDQLTAVKAGSKTLISFASLKSYLATLPRFVSKTGQAA